MGDYCFDGIIVYEDDPNQSAIFKDTYIELTISTYFLEWKQTLLEVYC